MSLGLVCVSQDSLPHGLWLDGSLFLHKVFKLIIILKNASKFITYPKTFFIPNEKVKTHLQFIHSQR